MKRAARVLLVLIAASAAQLGCRSDASDPAALPGEPDPLALVAVPDENPDPNVVEVTLEARTATKTYGSSAPTPVWTYNGSVPGPFIDAKVGDRVIVMFKNSLPEPTTIH